MKQKYDNHFFETDDHKYDNGYHDKLIQHRREKKLKNAIKCKNIREVMDFGDEGEFYY